ncbi:MAG: hypothetical protein AAF415_11145 [Pseudomonadota bacterium]
MRLLGALLLVTAAAGGAAWACPGPEAMAGNGVWIQTDDGGLLHFRREGDVVIETSTYGPEDVIVTKSHLGLYFLQDGNLQDGEINDATVNRYVYADPAALPDPDTPDTWAGAVEVFSSGGEVPIKHRLTIRKGEVSEMRIGACQYTGRVVTSTLRQLFGAGWTTEYFYLSDLGFAFFLAAGETPDAYQYTYRPIAISAEAP